MFINFTNHPSNRWSPEQLFEANKYGEIIDMSFPAVDPFADEAYIKSLAEKITMEISLRNPSAVLCQGEMTLVFAVANNLIKRGIVVLAACSERSVVEKVDINGETSKTAIFKFVRFRNFI